MEQNFPRDVMTSRREGGHTSCCYTLYTVYSANTYPFTDRQVDVVLKVLSARWMRDKEEQLRNYDFIDKDAGVSILSND